MELLVVLVHLWSGYACVDSLVLGERDGAGTRAADAGIGRAGGG